MLASQQKSAWKENLQGAVWQDGGAIESPVKQKTLKRRTISEHTRITGHAISPETQIFFHPDYTVGFGIAPNPAPERSRTIPPIGNFTLP